MNIFLSNIQISLLLNPSPKENPRLLKLNEEFHQTFNEITEIPQKIRKIEEEEPLQIIYEASITLM